jgi:hypothetical protein
VDIASVLGISEDALRTHYQQELQTGETRLELKVAEAVVRRALNGDMRAATFILERRFGWHQIVRTRVGADEDAPPLPPAQQTIIDMPAPRPSLSQDQVLAIAQALRNEL